MVVTAQLLQSMVHLLQEQVAEVHQMMVERQVDRLELVEQGEGEMEEITVLKVYHLDKQILEVEVEAIEELVIQRQQQVDQAVQV